MYKGEREGERERRGDKRLKRKIINEDRVNSQLPAIQPYKFQMLPIKFVNTITLYILTNRTNTQTVQESSM